MPSRGLESLLKAAAAAALLSAATPASAWADKVVTAQTVWRFDAASYTIDQGGLLTFRNADAASPGPHNVTSSRTGADGKPLFASKTIRNGEESPVDGARQLATGRYDFICTVHPFMRATLVVSDRGAPLQPPAPTAPDTRAPAVTASLDRTSLRRALRRRRVGATLRVDEPANLHLRLTAMLGRRVVLIGTATRTATASGEVAVVVRVRRSAVRALRAVRRVRLTLAVEARDSAGNVGTATARRTAAG